MSSFPRRLQRKALRKSPDYEPAEAVAQPLASGGYRYLHPTSGWRYVSALRAEYAAQGLLP